MELALALREIWRRKLWLIPVAVVAILAALTVSYHMSFFPPKINDHSFEYGSANTALLVDSEESSIAQLETPVEAIAQRASLYATLLKSQPVRQMMGKEAGIPWQAISVEGITGSLGTAGEPDGAERSAQLLQENVARKLVFTVEPGSPIVNLYAEAPNAESALRLVTAAGTSLRRYAERLQVKRGVPASRRVTFAFLGQPEGGSSVGGANESFSFLILVAVFGAGCFLILFIPRLVASIREAGEPEQRWDVFGEPTLVPLEWPEADSSDDKADATSESAGRG